MIRHIHLENFKSWKDLKIRFGNRLTVLFGANSAGKSSVIQFLLMLQETKNNPDRNRALDFGSERKKINLGRFQDVVHRGSKSIEWKIDWKTRTPLEIQDSNNSGKVMAKSDKLSIANAVDGGKQTKTRYLEYTINGVAFSIKPDGSKQSGYMLQSNDPEHKFNRIQGRPPGEMKGPLKTHLFPDQAKIYYQNTGFLAELEYAYESELIDRIHYLGPLREYPRREYVWDGSSPGDVGDRGQSTVNAILSAERYGMKTQMVQKGKGLPFQEALARRLNEMGLIHSFSVKEISKERDIYEVKVKSDKFSPEVLLTDVGIGVSQVLPAIVLLHYVEERSTVILEQPELHLHPSIQSTLADAIMNIAAARNLQVVVECHSEHFLNRILLRIAEEEKYNADDLALYNIAKEKAGSTLVDLEVNEFGEATVWPKNFFGDEMAEILATRKAALRKKRKIAREA